MVQESYWYYRVGVDFNILCQMFPNNPLSNPLPEQKAREFLRCRPNTAMGKR